MAEVSRSRRWVDSGEVREVAQRVLLGDAVQIGVVHDDEAVLRLLLDSLRRQLRLWGLLGLFADFLHVLGRHENLGLLLLAEAVGAGRLIGLNAGQLGSVLELRDLYQGGQLRVKAVLLVLAASEPADALARRTALCHLHPDQVRV